MADNDIRILTEPERYTPAINYQEKKKTYLWLQVKCEGDDKKHEKESVEQMELMMAKAGIDLRGDNSKWQTQFDSRFGNKKRQNVSCWRACRVILENYNVTGGNLKNNKALYQVAINLSAKAKENE